MTPVVCSVLLYSHLACFRQKIRLGSNRSDEEKVSFQV